MAYTLGDPFRPLRLILRVNALTLGLLLGLFFLLAPGSLFVRWGLMMEGQLWPLRLAGANQVAIGCFLLIASGQDYLNRTLLFTATLTHILWVITLLLAYLQQEFAALLWPGRLLFVLVFALCLFGAVMPLRYVRSNR
jgi:hypothetical protein